MASNPPSYTVQGTEFHLGTRNTPSSKEMEDKSCTLTIKEELGDSPPPLLSIADYLENQDGTSSLDKVNLQLGQFYHGLLSPLSAEPRRKVQPADRRNQPTFLMAPPENRKSPAAVNQFSTEITLAPSCGSEDQRDKILYQLLTEAKEREAPPPLPSPTQHHIQELTDTQTHHVRTRDRHQAVQQRQLPECQTNANYGRLLPPYQEHRSSAKIGHVPTSQYGRTDGPKLSKGRLKYASVPPLIQNSRDEPSLREKSRCRPYHNKREYNTKYNPRHNGSCHTGNNVNPYDSSSIQTGTFYHGNAYDSGVTACSPDRESGSSGYESDNMPNPDTVSQGRQYFPSVGDMPPCHNSEYPEREDKVEDLSGEPRGVQQPAPLHQEQEALVASAIINYAAFIEGRNPGHDAHTRSRLEHVFASWQPQSVREANMRQAIYYSLMMSVQREMQRHIDVVDYLRSLHLTDKQGALMLKGLHRAHNT